MFDSTRQHLRLRAVGLAAVLVFATLAVAGPVCAQQVRYFAYEYTRQTGNLIDFYSLTSTPQTVQVDIYNPNGSLNRTRFVTLRGYESVTLVDPVSTWGLPVVCEGTPTQDCSYGIVATAPRGFSIITMADESKVPGNGLTAIHPQGFLYTDSWWGMYNYPSSGDHTKEDYAFVFNANPTATNVTFATYRSNGTMIGSTTIPFAPFQTQKIYPQRDLGVPGNQQNIGIHMTAPQGVAVDVTTNLGDNFDFSSGQFTTHDNVQGAFVAQATSDLADAYVWENARGSDKIAGVRVTNPNGVVVSATMTIYTYDSTGPVGGNSWQVNATIPAFGTTEIGLPVDENFKNENVSDPWFHGFRLETTASVAVHVSFEENIDVPESPSQGLTSFWWGLKDPSRTRALFLFNPSDQFCTVHSESWYWTGATQNYEVGTDIVLGPFDALVTNSTQSSIIPLPPPNDSQNTFGGPSFTSDNDKVVHFYSDGCLFGVQLQEPDYGDVTPLVGGSLGATLGVEVTPNNASTVLPGTTVAYAHTVTNTGIYPDTYSLAAPSSLGWTTRIYEDADCSGILSAAERAAGTISSTSVVDGTESFCVVVEVDVPLGVPPLTVDTTTLTATSSVFPTLFDSAEDTTTVLYGSIGDRVWLDSDGDGLEDVGEPGLANVEARLFAVGPDGLPGTADDVLVDTTTTDGNGNYLFATVGVDTYYVDITDASVPSGLSLSPGSTDPSSTIVIAGGETFLDADFGYTNTSTTGAVVGDLVWSDADGDGRRDPGEPGIGGVTIDLVAPGPDGIFGSADDIVVDTATTAADGSYLFTAVAPGEYRADVTDTAMVLTGYSLSSGPHSEPDPTAPFTVGAGDVYLKADFGYRNAALFSISDRVWFDTDADGTFDAGEQGMAGVSVALLDAAGNVIATTTSDAGGNFTFDGLQNGDYTIEITDTAGRLRSFTGTTAAAQAAQLAVTVAGADESGVNFGYVGRTAVGDTVWTDLDADGFRDANEPGIGGVTLELRSAGPDSLLGTADDVVESTVTTAADGSYLFLSVPPGQYEVVVTDSGGELTGYTQVSDPDATLDGTGTANPSATASDLSMDFGYQNAALPDVSGTVFEDGNENGQHDAGENGFAGVTVDLIDPGPDGTFGTDDDLVIATATTDANGDYLFTSVPSGSYQVAVRDRAGVLQDYQITSGLDRQSITVAAADIADVDFGYIRHPATGAIGDLVWLDANRDGIRQAAEGGLAEVTLRLFEVGADGLPETADDVLVDTRETDVNGRYRFSDLAAGNYFVDVDETTLPAGVGPTPGTTDPSAVIALSDGEEYLDADFGYAASSDSAVGDRVWYDLDGDGFQDSGEVGIGGIDITVVGPSGTFTTTTAADGSWLVTGLAMGDYTVTVDTADIAALGYNTTPTNQPSPSIVVAVVTGEDNLSADFGFNGGTVGSIGDTVFFDADGDGFQDAGESGLSGVTLSLFDGSGNLLGTAITDAAGGYDFVGLPAGTYTVEVTDNSGVLEGLNLHGGASNPTDPIVLAAGEDRNDVDFPYGPAPGSGSIGNLVWHDRDGGGDLDAGESGFEGVTIELWRDSNGNGTIDPGVDNFLRATTTDVNGEYELNGLPAGDYLVDVTDQSGVLAGFVQTAGSDPTAVTLTAAAPSNFDVDFGYNAPSDRSLSGVTFEDVNGDGLLDGGDVREAGIELKLYRDLDGDGLLDPGEPLVGTTLSTGASGGYQFTNLAAAHYIVVANAAGTVLDGYNQTTQLSTSAVQPVDLAAGDSSGNDFGFNLRATLVVLTSFGAFESDGSVVVEWVTGAEFRSLGFYLFRWDPAIEDWLSLNDEPLPSLVGSPQGGTYRFVDPSATPWEPHLYTLVEVEVGGLENTYGPFEVEVEDLDDPPEMLVPYTAEPHPVSRPMQARLLRFAAGQAEAALVRARRVGGDPETEESEELGLSAARSKERFFLKLTVREAGLHRLSSLQISQLFGLTESAAVAFIEKRRFFLLNRGREVSWTAATDNRGILFYAEAVDSIYTRENVYWLGVGQSRRMAVRQCGGVPFSPSEQGFDETLHLEQDVHSAVAITTDPERGFWFWGVALAGNRYFGRPSFPVTIPAPAAVAATAELRMTVQALADGPAELDHRAALYLNGEWIGETVWDGVGRHSATLYFDQSLVADGQNLIEVEAIRDPGTVNAMLFIDAFDVRYRRRFEATGDVLVANSSGASAISIAGFTQPEVRVLDISNPLRPTLCTGVTVTAQVGGWGVSFAPPSRSTSVLAVAESQIRPVSDAVADVPADLTSSSRGAEHVIIAPLEFKQAAQRLADLRISQGLSSTVIDLEDIYDEFSYGLSDPRAIRTFIARALTYWRVPPRYVVLAGAGNYDYLDILGRGGNAIPPLLVATPFGLFASDNALADLVRKDGVPEVAIGRIPVLSAQELEAYVAKLTAYEADGGSGWKNRVLLVADDPDSGGDFTSASDELLALLPPEFSSERLYISELGAAQTRQRLLAELGSGVGWMNYVGHGGINLLANETILRSADIGGLGNGSRLPVVTALTCAAGRFDIPGFESLAEALVLEPGGGAVAVWSPTGVSLQADASALNRALFRAAFATGGASTPSGRVGDLALEAMRDYAAVARYPFMAFVYGLQGDPATLWRGGR